MMVDQAGLAYRGVAYDTGTNFETGQGPLSRAVWDDTHMRAEISAIADQLNCNSVTVYGSDLGRLAATAAVAADSGLHVWLQPRLADRPQQEVLDHLAEGAALAESLRAQGADVTLSIGAVHLLFTLGLVPGERYHERMANLYADANHYLLTPTGTVDMAAATPRLNEFLAKAVALARGTFHGTLGYSAAPFEDVDWSPFDVIGIMYQYIAAARSAPEHLTELRKYHRWGKPVVVSEFGTATYAGAEQKAFFFWDIADRSTPVPTILDGCQRDETAQADYHLKMFDIFEEAGMSGATVSEFIHPTHPHSDDPRIDLDTASMAIVKTVRKDFYDYTSDYYFEPKQSFHAIADHYAHLGFQASRR